MTSCRVGEAGELGGAPRPLPRLAISGGVIVVLALAVVLALLVRSLPRDRAFDTAPRLTPAAPSHY
jgi:hypothetical protein